MRRRALAVLFIFVAACASRPSPLAPSEPPGGTWSGDYGNADRRESIRVDLSWDGPNLRGKVYAGDRTLPLSKASFNKDTGAIAMEFDSQGNGGQIVHYTVEGKVSGDLVMSGTWTRGDQHGDFRVTRR